MQKIHLAAAVVMIAATTSAQAVHVTALPAGTVISLPSVDKQTGGPETLASGITWSSSNGAAVFGWTGGYGFGSNGEWLGLPMVGTNNRSVPMRIDFSTPVLGFGAFLNYLPLSTAAVIAAYDSSNKLLESYTLDFNTGGGINTGEFHGFEREVADISYVRIGGGYVGATNLTVVAVPEPETYALMGGGLLAVAAITRRRRQEQ